MEWTSPPWQSSMTSIQSNVSYVVDHGASASLHYTTRESGHAVTYGSEGFQMLHQRHSKDGNNVCFQAHLEIQDWLLQFFLNQVPRYEVLEGSYSTS